MNISQKQTSMTGLIACELSARLRFTSTQTLPANTMQ
jgi:hypothetical protein